ncbi:MAG TPA: cytochrome c oxidase subunit II [Gaiellaceae bacterium]
MRRDSIRWAAVAAFALCPLALAGCSGRQNVLDPHSHPERRIATLWWVMLTGAAIGFSVIVLFLFLGWVRRNRDRLPFGGGERAAVTLVVTLGIAVPIVVLVALFVWADLFVIKSTAAPNPRKTKLTVEVIGHQWFWEVRYPGTKAVTANEIHIPVGTPVNLVGKSRDVIHSFWVPELNRKVDLIPGSTTRILLEADEPGIYRGQCAEYCGLQHAHMSMYVIADPPARFRSWLADQGRPARAPRPGAAVRGARLFNSADACSGCHTIRGTNAHGNVGPDLTHVASRTTLAAATIPNRPGDLLEWISDPQHVKPGARMPALRLSDADFRAIATYLEGLR